MEIRQLSAPPNDVALLTRTVLGAVRPGGGRRGQRVPDFEMRLDGVRVDRARLAAYDRVCGFRITDTLPSTYPHVLTFPLSLHLMTDSMFPFPVLGLVHIRNQITQHRPVSADEVLRLTVRAENLRPHRRGLQIDVVSEVRVGDELVWHEISTHLRKGGAGSSGAPAERPKPVVPEADLEPVAVWQVPADMGRRYAAVSGDRNPIHLSSVSSRLFGFRRAIVHGMWTTARCLSALEGRRPPSYTLDVQFKREILLPARVALAVRESSIATWHIKVADARSGTPHLLGEISPN